MSAFYPTSTSGSVSEGKRPTRSKIRGCVVEILFQFPTAVDRMSKIGYTLVTLPRTCKAVMLQVTDMVRSYDLNFHSVTHAVTVSCERYTMGFPVCYGSQKHLECKEGESSGRWWRVTLHVLTCSGRNSIILLMRRPNTDSAPNMPVTLPRNQLLIGYVASVPSTLSRYCVTVRGNVTLCTHLYTRGCR
jgi:hypothetical protein